MSCNFHLLSDEEAKIIYEGGPHRLASALMDREDDLDEDEIEFILEQIPPELIDRLEFGSDITRECLLEAYGDNIFDYLYRYKEGLGEDDELHRGPMAQEVEKVDPSIVQERPDGLKEVDTGRLSLLNASAIGEIARLLQKSGLIR